MEVRLRAEMIGEVLVTAQEWHRVIALRNLCRPIQKAPMRRFPLVIALILSLAACTGEKTADSEPSASPTTAVSAAPVAANAPVILAFGDSL
jgi:acyl-CoA thioesterase-1